MQAKYEQRGVSADKKEVHKAIEGIDKGLYPNAFCKIIPDMAGGDMAYCNLMHADTAGTKTSLAYLYWKETGDLSVWKGIVQDAIVMNLDDMACVGCIDGILLSSTIGRNKSKVTGEVIKAIIQGANELVKELQAMGINIQLCGGETADVGDIVRTLDVGYTAFARMPRAEVIENAIQPGSVIVGIASYGQASYENSYNSGIGSNGLTNARHDMLHHDYASKYPEAYDPIIPDELVFSGPHHLTDQPQDLPLDIGKLLLSPTRTYLPYLKAILRDHRSAIQGMIHCTGGGQTKVMKFVKGLHVIKNNLFPTPPVFRLIQEASQASLEEMYQVFNMGHRLEIYTDEPTAQKLIDTAKEFNLEAKVVGHCEAATSNKLTIQGSFGELIYED